MAKISFHDLRSEFVEYFPTDKFLERLSAESAQNGAIAELDFSGLQYLTDEAFYGLFQKKAANKEIYDKILSIDCSGCVHITDQALKEIGRTFPYLRKIKLDGCREVTEKGLAFLGEDIGDVSMVGCNISAPIQIECCKMNYDGCPLIVDREEYKEDPAQPKESMTTKLSIFLDKDSKFSMINFLNDEFQDEYDDVVYRNLMCEKRKDEDKDMQDQKKEYFNVFECHSHPSYYSPLLSEKGLFVIALHVDKEILQNVMMIMNYVKGIMLDPVFNIVLLYNKYTDLPVKGREQIISTLAVNLKERWDVQNTNINNNIEEETFDGKQIQTSDFKAQQRFSRTWKMKDMSNEIEFNIFLLDTDTQMIALQYPKDEDEEENSRKEEQKIWQVLKEELNTKMEEWSGTWESAVNSLYSLNKADITELKSYSSAPAVVIDVMQGLLILFNNNEASKSDRGAVWRNAKRMLSNPNFLQSLLNYPVDSMSKGMVNRLNRHLEKVQLDMQAILRVSKCCGSFYTWMLALQNYGQNILPLKEQHKELESIFNPEIKSSEKKEDQNLEESVFEKSPAMLWKRLKKQANHLLLMEHVLQPSVWKTRTQKIWDVIQELISKKVQTCTYTQFLQEVHNTSVGSRVVAGILKKLHYQGHILYYPEIADGIIILDVSSFCHFMNRVYDIGDVAPANKERSVALQSKVPLFDREIISKACSAFLTEPYVDMSLAVLKYFGVVLDIPHVVGDDNASNKPFMFLFLHVETKPSMRGKLVDSPQPMSGSRFTRFYWPEGTSSSRLPHDAYVTHTYRMTYGMPHCVLTQILSECIKMGQVTHVWLFGFVVRCGTVDIKIQHNVHAFNYSSYIDVDARVTHVNEEADHQTVQEHLWSVVNTYLLVIEYYLDKYKLHVMQRIRCQGSCSATELPHFHSSANIKKEHNYIPRCSLCGDDQMSLEKVGYVSGKRGILPFHDAINPEDKDLVVGENSPYGHIWNEDTMATSPHMLWVCYFCGMSKQAAGRLWDMQCALYPIPDFLAFKNNRQKNHSLYFNSNVPLYLVGLKGFHVTPLRNCNVKVLISREDYVTDGIVFSDLKTLHQTRMMFDLKTGEYVKLVGSGKRKKRQKETLEAFEVGDRCTLEVTGSKQSDTYTDEDGTYTNSKQFVWIECVLKKNGVILKTFEVPYRSHASVLIELEKDKEKPFKDEIRAFVSPIRDGVLIECPTFPYVQAEHYKLGSALLYKTGLGSQYAVGFVHSTEYGKVTIKKTDGELTQPKLKHLLPFGLYTDVTITTGKDMLRTKEQMVQYLLDCGCNKVPFGMFIQHYNKKMTRTDVSLRSHHLPYTCTWNEHAPCVLEQLFNRYINSEGKSGKFNPPENHVFLPHNMQYHELIHAPRQTLQNWNKMALYFICKGPQWGMHNAHERDMHFMNKKISMPEPIRICTSFNYCAEKSKKSKKHSKEAPANRQGLSQIMEEDEGEELSEGAAKWKDVDSKVHLHAGDHMQVVMACHFMLRNKQNCLPVGWDSSMFIYEPYPVDSMSQLEIGGVYRMLSMYKDLFMWLDRLIEVANNYDVTKNNRHYRVLNKYLKTLFMEQVMKTDDKKRRMCYAHDFLGRKQNFAKPSTESDQQLDPFGLKLSLSIYASCISYFSVTTAGTIGRYFKQFLSFLPNLKGLQAMKCHLTDLSGINQCSHLEVVDVSDNHIENISEDLLSLKDTLITLNLSGNPFTKLPGFIVKLHKLRHLLVGNTLITELPEDIGELSELRVLSLKVHMVNKFPESLGNLQMLKDLNLQGVPWIGPKDNVTTYDQFQKWAARQHATKALPLMEMFQEADIRKNQALDEEELNLLNEKLIKAFPRIGQDCDPDDAYGGIPKEIFKLHKLKSLALGGQLIHSIPDAIGNLRLLKYLFLFYTPNLLEISSELGRANLNVLSLAGCPKCKTPPQEIIEKGMKVVLAYLKKLSQGSSECFRTKVMFVGLGGAGKTSLTRALMAKDHKAPVLTSEAITDGIDISTWTIKMDTQNSNLQYSVWDFAGQTVYYNTHQFFLSSRALYLLVWNTRLGYEHSGLDFWLSSIACHCPKAPIFIVGTHADQITKPELPMDTMKQRHPNIAGFFIVSSINGMGVQELYDTIVSVTLEQPYMGEMIPDSWLACEKAILHKRGTESLLSWGAVEEHAHKAGVYGEEVIQAVRFLHELGTLQHFENDLLKDKVVINPQWIVDVMSCMVSVHNKVIDKGYLQHKDISKIWSDYSSNLHDWLLRLTEVFDLTFPLHDKPVSVVPCLLPSTEPSYKWPNIEDFEGAKETKIVYTFDYLPAGLFNRVQVRLYQFSETSNMWKTGSVLGKNNHHALVKQIGSSQVLVKVLGLRPENILLMIHEVIEGLISDFFLGVKYEYQIPCPDCTVSRLEEPTMFTSKILRKAIEMKALFLQCHSLFHTLSIVDLQSNMPPQSGGDYEIQLESAVRDLDDLGSVIGTDLFLLFCHKDIPQENEKVVDVRQVKDDLEQRGFKCWFSTQLDQLEIEQVAVAMKNARVVVVFVSDEFALDEQCKRMFSFAKESLRKDIQLVMVGTGREWLKSDFIGIQLSDEVFVNLQRLHQYKEKFQELSDVLMKKLGSINKPQQNTFDVFLSYAWVNSSSAVKQGQATSKEGSLGHGDPRMLKDFLTDNGLSCWIDKEQVGRMGLYEDIATGMKQSKVIVACISDEYVLSSNCQIEFRFAHTSLRKPIILAVMGTGFLWESTEIGMLSLGYPKINFQVANNVCHSQLLQYVQEALDSVADKEDAELSRAPTPNTISQKEMAFQELYEMAQRKFLRQVCSYNVGNTDPYPRLMVADLNYDPITNALDSFEPLSDADICLEEDSNKPLFVIDDLQSGQFCIKLLCEYEGGWHCVHQGLPIDLSGKDLLAMWRLVSPYMARMLAILKHSNINLHIVRSAEGDKLLKNLEELLSTEMHMDVQPVYLALRAYIMSKDVDSQRGNLKRCYMPSGKMLWLCEEHQKQPRVTVLEDSELEPDGSGVSPEINLMSMLEKEMVKKTTDELEENVEDELPQPSRPVRAFSAKLSHRAGLERSAVLQRRYTTSTSADVNTSEIPPSQQTTKLHKATTKSQPHKPLSTNKAKTAEPEPLTERERTALMQRASMDNLASVMGASRERKSGSENGPSQACSIL